MLTRTFLLLALLQLGNGDESCTHSAKLDLQIIVDSSASVGVDHFRTMMKKISSSLIGQFEIGKDKTRVALFKYSMKRVMRNEIRLNSFVEKADLQKKIESTSFEPGWTMTAMAMNEALGSFKKLQRKDKNTARVCLVFTDGEATDQKEVPAASKAWANDGVTVFAIGIGSGVSHNGLKDIAGADERALEVKNFEAIGEMAKGLLKKVCKNVEAVKPTKVPKAAPTAMPTKTPDVPQEDLYEVDFSKGEISATSQYSSKYAAKNAFVLQTKGKLPWINKDADKFPVIVWSKFPSKLTVAKLSFSSRSDNYLFKTPTNFELVGSKDCKQWKVIAGFTTKFTKLNQARTWTVPKKQRQSFSCIGIKVNRVTKGSHAAIQNIRMWKELKEVDFSKGKISATSQHSSKYGAKNAFVLQTKGNFPWINNNKDKFPVIVWSKFPRKITVAKISFASRIDGYLFKTPTMFELVGSEDCEKWKVIAGYTTKFTKLGQVKTWVVPKEQRQSFSCIGVKVKKVAKGLQAAIQNVRMWEV